MDVSINKPGHSKLLPASRCSLSRRILVSLSLALSPVSLFHTEHNIRQERKGAPQYRRLSLFLLYKDSVTYWLIPVALLLIPLRLQSSKNLAFFFQQTLGVICKLQSTSHFRGVTTDGAWIREFDLLNTCTHHSELQVITAPSLVSILYKSP
jgi:hypothetical protein